MFQVQLKRRQQINIDNSSYNTHEYEQTFYAEDGFNLNSSVTKTLSQNGQRTMQVFLMTKLLLFY